MILAATSVGMGSTRTGYLFVARDERPAPAPPLMVLGRLTLDGTLDASFGTDGFVTLLPNLPAGWTSPAVTPAATSHVTGRILVAVNGSLDARRGTVLLALDRDGARQSSFTGAWLYSSNMTHELTRDGSPPPRGRRRAR